MKTRARKMPSRFCDEFQCGDMTDDYAFEEHDTGHFDDDDDTFKTPLYEKYHYDNFSEIESEASVDDISERLSIMSMEGGGDDSYESDFVENDIDPATYEEDPDWTV